MTFSESDKPPANDSTPNRSSGPLAGLRLIDLSMGWAGPLAARNLADLGATVIKVESCTRFDWWRSWEATPEWIADDGAEKALAYLYVNRNKLDVTLDLEHSEGRRLLLELVRGADALIENYSGAVLPKLRLDYSHLAKVNPGLVMISMPAFGQSGPWSEFRAYGSTVEQSSGLPHLVGHANQPPTMQHVAFGDPIGGLNGTAALLTALWHRQRTGEGQLVDLSQVECLFPHAAPGILHQAVHGAPPTRIGNDSPEHAPHGVYPCHGDDRWILIQVTNQEQWHALCRHVPALADKSEMTSAQRLEARRSIDQILAGWSCRHSSQALMLKLQQVGIIAATLHHADDLLDDPQLDFRGYMQWLDRAFIGKQPHPSPPWRDGPDPLQLRDPAPTLGQHNKEVLGGDLGLSDEALARLEKQGIIGTKPRLD